MADRTVINYAGIEQLKRSVEAQRALLEAARPLVARVRALTPKRTGAGAGSIHAEAVLVGAEWHVRVSWDRAHNYLRFVNDGTRRGVEPHRFLQAGAGIGVSFIKRP